MNVQSEVPTAEVLAQKSHRLVASDRVEGTPVRRPGGEKIGTVQRLMIDKVSGNVAYAVLVFGGFLGMGRKHLPIPWTRLKYDLGQEVYLAHTWSKEREGFVRLVRQLLQGRRSTRLSSARRPQEEASAPHGGG